MTRLFVDNLHFSVTEEELRQYFSQFGEVMTVSLIMDTKKKKSKGFGFIDMKDETATNKALEINGKTIRGRQIKIAFPDKE
ncbi:MAG: RNA-binding protein [Bacteroidales bacterium]|nr:RNA-binding protein [Bacteroidales bacterium]